MEQPSDESLDPPPEKTRRLHRSAWVSMALVATIMLGLLAHVIANRHAPICIAAHNTLTGPSGPSGLEAVESMQLRVDEVNGHGGIDGHPIELVRVDDEGNADKARANVRQIAESRCVAVLGHRLSTTSLAAAPLYKAHHIPALTGTTHVDELTDDNPWYFRAQNTSSAQGRSIAEYVRIAMGEPLVHLVTSDAKFDRAFAKGFAEAYDPDRVQHWNFDANPASRSDSARTMALSLMDAEPGVIILGTGEDSLPDVIKAVRRQDRETPIIAAAGAGFEEFVHRFDEEPEERAQPGYFTRNLYAAAPLIFDSAGAEAQDFGAAYKRMTGRTPGWIAASAYEAARIMIEAVRRANVLNREDTVARDRERVRDALEAMDSPEHGLPGFVRTLYFDAGHNMLRPVRIGFFRARRFVSAPEQLVQVDRPETIDVLGELQKGNLVTLGGRYYWRQRVVYAGIDINRLNRIDVKDGSFNVDLNFWMRFSGDDDAPTHVEFPGLLDRDAFDPARPFDASVEDGLNYRFYRIIADFKNTYDLHDYPFDRQELLIRFQNRQQRHELVTYVVDRFGMNLTNGNNALPADSTAYSGLQQWRPTQLRYFVDSLSSVSSLGKPSLFGSAVRTEFSGYNAAMVLQRNAQIYVIKTMIPLMLLVLVVFATLFLPMNLFRERINIPVTAILTSAVLLLSVNNQLGDIGYTITIEYIFYAFFALCLGSMLIGIAHDALCVEGKTREARVLAVAGQLAYVLTVAGVVVHYWWLYRG